MGRTEDLTYKDDYLWLQAKKVAKAGGFNNKWIEIIDYYNLNEGKNVQIFCTIDKDRYRILYILDSHKVLVQTRDKELCAMDYTEVDESRKIFFYQDEPTKVVDEAPENETFLEQETIEFFE